MTFTSVLFGGCVRLLAADQGGRHRPVYSGYRCQFRFVVGGVERDWDATILFLVAELAPGTEAPSLLLPISENTVWDRLLLPSQLGMYEGNCQVGSFDVSTRYIRNELTN
jgi:hypothetical protein